MPIVPSRARRIHELVEQLGSGRAAERDSAVAQLTLHGARVVEPLVASLSRAGPAARLAALDVLEGLDDHRVVPVLLGLAADASDAVARKTVELLGARADARAVPALDDALRRGRSPVRRAAVAALSRLHGRGVVEALAPLVDTLLDDTADTWLRLEILEALLVLDPPLTRFTLRPLARRLAASPDRALAERAAPLTHGRSSSPRHQRALVGRLTSPRVTPREVREITATLRQARPTPAALLRDALETAREHRAIAAVAAVLGQLGDTRSIPALSRTLTRLAAGRDASSDACVAARAAIHRALAGLDSRIALHDLRDLVAARPPVAMPSLLEAAARVGDVSLVPALAQAARDEPSLLEPCAHAYATIARRHGLRRTSAALRRVKPEHRATLEAFLSARRRRR